MKKLILTAAISLAALAPVAASAADPSPSDFKNAAQYCKALKAASGSNFSAMFASKKQCKQSVAKKTAKEDAKQEDAAKTNAAKDCKAERDDAAFADAHGGKTFDQFYGSDKNGKNAYGKCVSTKAKAKKDEADAEDEQQQDDRVNAAKTCKTAKNQDAAAFSQTYGSRKNAFGKCVSKTAKQLAAEREAETA